MRVRKCFVNSIIHNKEKQRLLALTLFLKTKLDYARFLNYEEHEFAKITGLSFNTVHKYIPKLIKEGYAHFEGKHKCNFIINHINHKVPKMNYVLTDSQASSYKNILCAITDIINKKLEVQ